jgi:hypothetical protein
MAELVEAHFVPELQNEPQYRLVDMGGSVVHEQYRDEIAAAFRHQGDFPRNLIRLANVDYWSYVHFDEYEIIDQNEMLPSIVDKVFTEMNADFFLVDLGFFGFPLACRLIDNGIEEDNMVGYMIVDPDRDNIVNHMRLMRHAYPDKPVLGLWGSIEQALRYLNMLPEHVPRVYTSLHSSFLAGSPAQRKQRCDDFRGLLRPMDRLIITQDCSTMNVPEVRDLYESPVYLEAFVNCLAVIMDEAELGPGYDTDFTVQQSITERSHWFRLIAERNIFFPGVDDFYIEAGTVFDMARTDKLTEQEAMTTFNNSNLFCERIFGGNGNPGMADIRAYMIKGVVDDSVGIQGTRAKPTHSGLCSVEDARGRKRKFGHEMPTFVGAGAADSARPIEV